MTISKEAIIDLEYLLIEGIKTSDVKLLDSLLHDELLFMAPNGQVITKQMDLASHKGGEITVEQLIPTFEEVSLIDDVAVVTVVYDTKGTMLASPIRGKFRYIRIWKGFDDGFKVIGGSCIQLDVLSTQQFIT